MHVLLIEDDPTVGQFIVDELVAAGHDCLWRRDGDSGLAAARGNDTKLPCGKMMGLDKNCQEQFWLTANAPDQAEKFSG